MQDADSLKLDAMCSLIRAQGEIIKQSTAAIEANTASFGLLANGIESMAEAFRELTERITAEPDAENAVHQLLEHIQSTGTANYNMLTQVLAKFGQLHAWHL